MSFSQKNPFNADANFTSIKFGVNKPVLEVELNEMQSIMYHKSKNNIKTLFGDGVIGKGDYKYSSGTFTLANEVVLLDGDILNIDSVSVPVLEGESLYLHSWAEEVTYESEIKKHGNKNSNTTVPNHIKDARLNMETSRRTQLFYSLSTTLDSTKSSLKLGTIKGGVFELSSRVINSHNDAKMFNLPFEGTSISLENTEEGFVSDLEILGNTYQDTNNLSIIKSSGEVLEDGRYKLSFLCRGKNLFDGELEIGTLSNTTGENLNAVNESRSINYICVNTNSVLISRDISEGALALRCYDSKFNFIGVPLDVLGSGKSSALIELLPKTKYIRFKVMSSNLNIKYQIEEDTQVTQYEDYKEYVQDVYLPCDFSRTGSVADRLICKEGIWGVEKNTITDVLDGNRNWLFASQTETHYRFAIGIEDIKVDKFDDIICDRFTKNTDNTFNTEGVLIHTNKQIHFIISKSKLPTVDIDGVKKWVNENNILVKYPLAKPQFIPLPDVQQVKLKTFMNHTNIMYLGEIAPTIKGKVSKSLNATVYNNVQAIERIDRELEGVKRLEQATNTVITTEKDFVSIENTNVGFVKSVELEGNTWVNLINPTQSHIHDNNNMIYYSNTCKIGTNGQFVAYNFSPNILTLSINKVSDNEWVRAMDVPANSVTPINLDNDEYVYQIIGDFSKGWTKNDLEKLRKSLVLLKERVNLNTYFEGLKSVGENAEDIKVTSSNGGNMLSTVSIEEGSFTWATGVEYEDVAQYDRTNGFIEVHQGQTLYRNTKCVFFLYDKNKEYLGNTRVGHKNASTQTNEPYIVEPNVAYIRIIWVKTVYNNNVYVGLDKSFNNTPHKQDTQKVLYKDKEGNYKKPILRKVTDRGRDTIELHNDNKLYCHKRCGEFVYKGNPNENWTLYNANDTHICVRIPKEPNMASGMSEKALVCNLFPIKTIYDNALKEEGCYIDTQASAVFVRIAKSKADTVENFKKYLQANNMILVFALAQEEIYRCLDLNLQSFEGSTNYHINCGAITPKSKITLSQNIGNVVSDLVESNRELQTKVSNLLDAVSYEYESDNGYINIPNSKEGTISDVRLDGKTCINVIQKQSGLFNTSSSNTHLIHTFIDLVQPLEVGETYTFIAFNLPSHCKALYLGDAKQDGLFNYTYGTNVIKFVGTEGYKNITTLLPHFRGESGSVANPEDYKDVKLLILKGDHTQNPPKEHFEGLKSVGDTVDDIEITTINENLFNGEVVYGFINAETGVEDSLVNKWCKTKEFIKIEPNTSYYFGSKATSTKFNCVLFYDINKNLIDRAFTESSNSHVIATTPVNAHYVRMRFRAVDDATAVVPDVQEVIIMKSKGIQDYVPSKYDTQKVLYRDKDGNYKKPVLREGDYIERLADGKLNYYKCSEEYVLNGSEREVYSKEERENTVRFSLVIGVNPWIEQFPHKDAIISDWITKNNDAWSIDTVGIENGVNDLSISILKTMADTEAELREYLRNNPITIVRKLKRKQVYECLELNLLTFKGNTNCYVSSGAIVPNTKIRLAQSLGNTVSDLVEDTKELQEKVSEVLDVVAYDYESDSNYVTMKSSKKGVLDNVRIEGNTVVNLSNSSVTGLGGGATNNKNVITLPKNGSVAFLCTDKQGLQGKTLTVKYHAPLEVGNDQLKACIRYKDVEGVVQPITEYAFVNGITFTVPNVEYKAINIHLNNAKDEAISQEYKITCVECDKPVLQYFEGIKSVGELAPLEIHSRREDGNLFDINDPNNQHGYHVSDVTGTIVPNPNCMITGFIPITSPGRYIATSPSYQNRWYAGYDASKKHVTGWAGIADLNIPESVKYLVCTINNADIPFFRLDKGTQAKNTPHKSDKKKLMYKDTDGTWKPVILRKSSDNCKDYIEELPEGRCKYHKRCDEKLLKGSPNEVWAINSWQPTNKDLINVYINIPNAKGNGADLICDNFVYYDINKDDKWDLANANECVRFSAGNNNLLVNILKSKLTTEDANGIKKWVESNPFKIVYPLAQEEVYECVDMSLSSFEGETSVFTSSPIPHKLKITQKQGLKARLEALEQEVNSLDGKTPEVSEDLVNADVVNFKVGVGTVKGLYRDHSKEMVQSLVTLDNIKGKTVKQGNILKSVTLGSIVNGGQETPLNIKWNIPEVVHNNATFTSTGNSVKITCTDKTWAALQYNFNVEPNTEYAFMCDWETTSETAYVLIKDGEGKETYYRYEAPRGECSGSGLSTIFRTGNSKSVQLTLYSSVFYVGGYTEYKNLKVIARPKGIVDTNITLRSLPNGVCDTLENGNVYTNIIPTVLNGKEADWVHWKTANNIAVYYTRPSGVKHFADDDSNTGIICDKFPSLAYNETIEPTKEGVSLYSGYGYIGVCIASSKASNLDNFKAWLKTNPITVYAEYYDDWKIVTPVNPTIIANRGDVIHIDSSLPVTCSHKVYLNTKAQVEETQKVVDSNVKSIFDIKKWISNFKVSMYTNGDNGFIKLPKVLGGLTIQWGTVADIANNTITKVNYPIAFSSTVKYVGANMQGEWYAEGGVANSSNGVVCNRRDLTFFNIGHNFGTARSLNWIAIGF